MASPAAGHHPHQPGAHHPYHTEGGTASAPWAAAGIPSPLMAPLPAAPAMHWPGFGPLAAGPGPSAEQREQQQQLTHLQEQVKQLQQQICAFSPPR
eukprot:416898-Prorocentrum_minimum.AAC.1